MARLSYYRKHPNGLSYSYSQREMFHSCARKFQIESLNNHSSTGVFDENQYELGSLVFAYGHAVAAGVQFWLTNLESITDADERRLLAVFEVMKFWDVDCYAFKAKRSLHSAITALDNFINFYGETLCFVLQDWKVATIAGKPAVELRFAIDLNETDAYCGNIDLILEHKVDKRYRVLELKTTYEYAPDEALYGNSDQMIGYAGVVLAESVRTGVIPTWDVLYLVYAYNESQWHDFVFDRQPQDIFDLCIDLLQDIEIMNIYRANNLFPKRGGSCRDFRVTCAWYGQCGNPYYTDTVKPLESSKFDFISADELDLHFTLEELISAVESSYNLAS